MMQRSISLIGLLSLGVFVVTGLVILALLVFSKKHRLVGIGLLGALGGTLFFVAVVTYLMLPASLSYRSAQMPDLLGRGQFRRLPSQALGDSLESQILLEEAGHDDQQSIPPEDPGDLMQDNMASDTGRPRPAWVDEVPRRDGSVYTQVAVAGPYTTIDECDRRLDRELMEITSRYLERIIPEPAGRLDDRAPTDKELRRGVARLREMAIDPDYIRQRVCVDEYIASKESGTLETTMYTIHSQLRFDDEIKTDLKERWSALRVRDRLWLTGESALLVLAAIGVVFTYLRVDTATKGYYSRRLQLAAVVAILAIVSVGMLFLA